MKKIFLLITVYFSIALTVNIWPQSKSTGETCFAEAECAYGLTCKNGVCIKKPEFDFGDSSKTGKQCNIDADCIEAGKCVSNNFGQKYCSGK